MNRYKCSFESIKKFLAPGLLGLAALLGGASQAWAQELGLLENFAVLSAAPESGGAVTCTDSTIIGDVGSSGAAASVVQTRCVLDGAIIAPVSEQVVDEFEAAYGALSAVECDVTLTTLAGEELVPGTYCVEAASTTTDGVLTLVGGPNDTWLFKIGTGGGGALTGTRFEVIMEGGAEACNVTWWVADAATMTNSSFNGTILAGAAITFTEGSDAESRALARAAVTLTDNTQFVGCEATGGRGLGKLKAKCNQGVGNGPESCDPGNSNQGDPSRSNDELGGTPGDPGRKGGNQD